MLYDDSKYRKKSRAGPGGRRLLIGCLGGAALLLVWWFFGGEPQKSLASTDSTQSGETGGVPEALPMELVELRSAILQKIDVSLEISQELLQETKANKASIKKTLAGVVRSELQTALERKTVSTAAAAAATAGVIPAGRVQDEHKNVGKVIDDRYLDYVGQLQPPIPAIHRPWVREGGAHAAADHAHAELVQKSRPFAAQQTGWSFKPVCEQAAQGYNFPAEHTATVVVCFHNEDHSLLETTLRSVLQTVPPRLLDEILVLQDGIEHQYDTDDRENVKLANVESIRELELPKVRAFFNEQALGVAGCRQRGAELAVSNVLVFLDSHILPRNGWIEPLLQAVTANEGKTIAHVVVVDHLSGEVPQGESIPSVGYFRWWHKEELAFAYKWTSQGGNWAQTKTAMPYRTEAIPGGLFAVKREHFWGLKGYDSEFQLWGFENLEMSLKEWMCGGMLVVVPCSMVEHVHREKWPFGEEGSHQSNHNRNRVISTWVTEPWRSELFRNLGVELEEQKSLFAETAARRRELSELQCNNFDWYLTNVDTSFNEELPSHLSEKLQKLKQLSLSSW